MIEFTTAQKGSAQYLICDLTGKAHQIDDITVMMINSNQKKNIGMARISFEELNGEKQKVLFDITGMMPLSEYLRRNQTQASFRSLILALASGIENFDEYMIDLKQVVLNPDHVYFNFISKQITFICVPFTDAAVSGEDDLYSFFCAVCNIAGSNVEFHPGEISYFNMVLTAMASKTAFSVSNLKQVLAPAAAKQQSAAAAGTEYPVPEEPQQKRNQVQESGDVPFVPGAVPVQKPAAGKAAVNTEPGITPMAMPETDKKEDKSLFGKIKKKFMNKKDDAEEPEEQGGLAALASGKKEKKPAKQEAPAAVAPPVQMPASPAAPAAESPHTILIPSGGKAAGAEAVGGIAGLNARINQEQDARINQVQEELFSAPAPEAVPQTAEPKNVLGGGMAGVPEVGLPPMQGYSADTGSVGISAPSAADDPKTVMIVPGQEQPGQGGGDTTVRMNRAWLIRRKNQVRTELDQPMIRIGRNRDDVDINLPENLHVGHLHASIVRVGSGFAVVDNKSANHTFLNGRQLAPYEQNPLKNGDIITFADEEFEFRTDL